MARAGGCGQKAGPGRDRGRDVFIRGAEESSRGIHEKWMQRKADGEGAGVSNTANIGELVLGSETDRTAQGKVRESKGYSEGQRREAVEYYFAHGMSLMKTIRELALPIKRDALRNWIKEFEPERELNCKRPMPLVQCTQEQKEEAVAAILCTRGKTGQEIAEEYGVSRPAVYKWRRHFLAREGDMAMPGTDEERKALEEKNAELVRELQRARRELEETEKGCIGYGWNAMCWKRWRKC